MRSVLIPVASLTVRLAQGTTDEASDPELNQLCFDFTASQNSEQPRAEVDVQLISVTDQVQDEVQYSELPGVLMLGADGKLRPLYHGPESGK